MTNPCSGSTTPPRKVSIAEAVRTVDTRLDATGTEHAIQLTRLQSVRQAKSATLAREQSRLTQTLGADHPRVTALTQQIALNDHLSAQIERTSEVAQAQVPRADDKTWVVHGHVRTKEMKAVPRVTVALYTCDGRWLREFGHDCTDDNGHFKLCVKAGEASTAPGQDAEVASADVTPLDATSAGVKNPEASPARATEGTTSAAVEKGGETLVQSDLSTAQSDAAAGGGARKMFLRVTDEKQMLLGVDAMALTLRPGHVDYREIILGGTVCTPPQDGEGRPGPGAKTRYLGNSQKREVHDLQNTKKGCQIDEIAPDRRVPFATVEDAVKARYDYCAYCFGKLKSKR